MKTNLIMSLVLVFAFNSDLAADGVSTLAQRAEVIAKALEKGPKEAVEAINKAQKGDLKVDDSNYIVVVEKSGDVYKRIAHFKGEKLDTSIEPSLLNIVQEAEKALASGTGPVVAFSFSASDNKKMYALLSKKDNLLIFNICSKQEEVDDFLKPAAKVEEKKQEVGDKPVVPTEAPKSSEAPSATTVPVVTENSKVVGAPETVKVEEKKLDGDKSEVRTETKPTEAKVETWKRHNIMPSSCFL